MHALLKGLLVAIAIAAGTAIAAGRLDGRYVAEEEPSVTLTLVESPDGAVTGTLLEVDSELPVNARRQGSRIAGTIGSGSGGVPFSATLQEARVLMDVGPPDGAERLTFKRIGDTEARPQQATTGKRSVIINGRRYSDQELAAIERTYRIRIPDADYWYDRVLGAWGVRGSPTLGFISPGLDLGGTLRPDASGGGTFVFVNGRELHARDLLALQQITGPIAPGRYFITAQGLAGVEGGPPQWNLAAMVAQAQGGGGGNNWQGRVTGASGFSDGETSAVFLPNGGIVSVGR